MSYLVYFKDALGQEWEETLETECQVLEHQMKECIVSVKKIDKELTLEQLQEQVDNKTPQKLQEADFKDKHIKVGNIVYFQYKYWDHYDNEYSYTNYFGRVKSLVKQYNKINITVEPIATEGGFSIDFEEYEDLDKEVQNDKIETIWDVCTPEYFGKRIMHLINEKANAEEKFKKEMQDYCKQKDEEIERLKVLKGMI
jgi:hypothetical protein